MPGGRCGVRIAASKMLNASLVNPASVSPTPASCELSPAAPAPESRYLRAARQIGHHWHSGGSSPGGSVVAVSHTLDDGLPPRTVDLTLYATSRPRLRAPAFISHRWRSPIGSLLPRSLILVTVPLQIDHIRRASGAEVANVDTLGAADPRPARQRVMDVAEQRVPRLGAPDHV